MRSNMVISRTSVVKFLTWTTVLIGLGGVASMMIRFGLGIDWGFGLVYAFNFVGENTLPTLFNVLLLVFNGILFLVIWKQNGQQKNGMIWLAVGLFVFVFTYDEFAALHEALSRTVYSGYPDWFFAVPYFLVAATLGIFFLPVYLGLDRRVQFLMAISVIVYGIGAMDSLRRVATLLVAPEPLSELARHITVMAEELMEMGALITLSSALLLHLQLSGGIQFALPSRVTEQPSLPD